MIYIYGASDDLIEIDGDLREEFTYAEYDPNYIATSNGFLAKIKMDDDGDWVIRTKGEYPAVSYTRHGAGSEKAKELSGSDYTEVLIILDDVKWVVHGTGLAGA